MRSAKKPLVAAMICFFLFLCCFVTILENLFSKAINRENRQISLTEEKKWQRNFEVCCVLMV